MADRGLPFFQGYLYTREERGEVEAQRPGFLSEKTNIEENTFLWPYQRKPQDCSDIFNPLHG